MRPWIALALVAFTAACAPPSAPGTTVEESSLPPARASGHGGGTALTIDRAAQNHAGIAYGGGPVMLGTPNVYFIWYGNWTNNSATTILPDFMSHLGGSPYFLINSTYYDSAGNHVSGDVNYAGSTSDSYSQGSSLSDASIASIVQRALSSGALPIDDNAVYFVLTSKDVSESGFCSGFCGWHEDGNILGHDIKYSFVGNPEQCPSSCAPYSPSPNGNLGADGMASVLAHELEESVTDPDLDAWTDSAGENADKCAWKFGTTYTTASGAKANMKLGTRDYLIQQNLVETTGQCALSLGGGGGGGGPKVTVLGPSAGSVIHPGGALDITASVSDPVSISSARVNWNAPSGTTQFTMTRNGAGNWEFSSTLASTAKTGTTRSFTVTATDASGQSATSTAVTIKVQ